MLITLYIFIYDVYKIKFLSGPFVWRYLTGKLKFM